MYGKQAYDGYRGSSGGKSLVTGEPIPFWDKLPADIQEAWEAAGEAVYNAVKFPE